MLASIRSKLGTVWGVVLLCTFLSLAFLDKSLAAPEEPPDFDLSGGWKCHRNCGAAAGVTLRIAQSKMSLDIATTTGETVKASASLRKETQSSLKCLLKPPPAWCANPPINYQRNVWVGGWSCDVTLQDSKGSSSSPPPFKVISFELRSVSSIKTPCKFSGSVWVPIVSSSTASAPGTDCFVHIAKHIKTHYPEAKLDTTMRYWGPYQAGSGLPLYSVESNTFTRDGYAYSASWEIGDKEALMDAYLLDANCRVLEIKNVYHEKQ